MLKGHIWLHSCRCMEPFKHAWTWWWMCRKMCKLHFFSERADKWTFKGYYFSTNAWHGKVLCWKKLCIYESQVFLLLVLGLPVKEHCASIWLVRGSNDVLMSSDAGNRSMLALLDLSSAFDTVDYHILIKKLHEWVGISGSALDRFSSYLTDRSFAISFGDFLSGLSPLSCGCVLCYSPYICCSWDRS